jgi:hypothetical protein
LLTVRRYQVNLGQLASPDNDMKPYLFLFAFTLVLSACGGGSSSDSVPVVPTPTPTPNATPTPAPTPTPTPTARAITFNTPSVTALIDASGAAQVLAAVSSSAANTLSVTDPDAPLAASFEDLALSGNEAFSVARTDGTSRYNAEFPSVASTGATTVNFYGSDDVTPRPVTVLKWHTGATAGSPPELNVIQAQATDRPTPVLSPANLPVHARLIETVAADRRALQLIGMPTPAGGLSGQNGVQYSGEAYGTVFTADKKQLQFIGQATIYVDGGDADSQIHGIINVNEYTAKITRAFQSRLMSSPTF